MITNLFSVFDPAAGPEGMSLNWGATLLGLGLVPYLYWRSPSRITLLLNSILGVVYKELKLLLGPGAHRIILAFISVFTLIILNNCLGLVPYIFTSTSHISISLRLSLPMWVSFMLFGWINHAQHIFAHLVPQGTPAALIVFIVLIETTSNVIRPGTLAIRLSANIVAGHLLLTLMGNAGPALGVFGVAGLVLGQNLLMLLEIGVAIIQAYVFTVLTTLYVAEVTFFSSIKNVLGFQPNDP